MPQNMTRIKRMIPCIMMMIMATTAFHTPMKVPIHSLHQVHSRASTKATATSFLEPFSFVRRKTNSLPSLSSSSSFPLYAHTNGDAAAATATVDVFATSQGDEDNSNETLPASTLAGIENGRKVINTVLLALSFGFALFTILSIDNGITRGWSPTEIAARIPIDNWASYESSLSAQPIATKTIINVVIYLLGDWLSQTLFQGKDILDFDASRTLRNGFIGLCFGPLVHMYYEFSDSILPVEVGYNKFYKIFMDQTIYLSVKCSIYIMAIGLLNGEAVEDTANNVKERIVPIMFTAWKFWPLVHCITYSVIPARHRILWVNSVDLVWNAILASKARSSDDDLEDEPENIIEEDVVVAIVGGGNYGEIELLTNVTSSSSSDVDEKEVNGDDVHKSLNGHSAKSSNKVAEKKNDRRPSLVPNNGKMMKDEKKDDGHSKVASEEEFSKVIMDDIATVEKKTITALSTSTFTNSSSPILELKS
mmetsp:Transcript_25286/g.36677  ORF Transcript_25286/g.36677 Transcript_25286/m.36677 type:complete len:478 (+) Transcript_25286:173-1606(+)